MKAKMIKVKLMKDAGSLKLKRIEKYKRKGRENKGNQENGTVSWYGKKNADFAVRRLLFQTWLCHEL